MKRKRELFDDTQSYPDPKKQETSVGFKIDKQTLIRITGPARSVGSVESI